MEDDNFTAAAAAAAAAFPCAYLQPNQTQESYCFIHLLSRCKFATKRSQGLITHFSFQI